jgi:hypothetical protein
MQILISSLTPLTIYTTQGKVTGYFKAPGYLQALDEMLPVVGHLMESSDGFMSRSYYSYVGMHVSHKLFRAL